MTRTFEDDLIKKLGDPEFAKIFGAAQVKSSFALALAKARRTLGLTQGELANKVGVSQAYISRLEGGEANPTLERIGSLLAILGLSLTMDTTTLSPYPITLPLEDTWPPVPSLITAFEGVPFITDATEGIGSSPAKRDPLKIA